MENKKMNNSTSYKWLNTTVFISLFFTTVLCFLSAPSFAGLVHGYVYTRTIVTNDSGNYTWVEYNPATGSYVRDIGVATGDLDPSQWRAMSGNEYRSYVKQKSDLHNAQPDLVLMSRTDYEANPILLADGNSMSKPGLGRTTAYVSILPQIRRLIDDPASLILAEYPVNPEITIAADILSMLHKYNGPAFGETKTHTTNRIGFKTAFAKDEAGNPIPIGEDSWVSYSGNEAAGPISNAQIEAWLFYGATTDSKGHFVMSWPSIPCPLVSYAIDSSMLLKLQYRRFNPKGGSRGLNYYETHPMSEVCIPNLYFVPFFGPIPLGLGEVHTYPTYPVQFNLDLSVLSGTAQLAANVATQSNRVQLSGERVLVGGATQYIAESPDNSDKITSGYDYDRDGTQDTVVAGHTIPDPDDATKKLFVAGAPEEVQAVWLSSGGLTPQTGQPDLTRAMDSVSFANFTHQGLLGEISAEDLRNTDIYIVRVSDGKLISERIGLNEYDTIRSRLNNTFGEDTENDQFFYNIQMQGSLGDRRFITSSFSEWQSYSGINPDLHQRESDHVQPGDAIRIYAINRATGYIGHADTIMQAGSNLGDEKTNLASGDISFHIDPIIMGPPNLKIRAERGYKITSGVTKSTDTISQLIGFEGASLTSDNTVTITTEWLDHEGRPIPESLAGAGYTGRISILSGDKTLSSSNQGVYQFPIDPGQRLQVLQLPNALTDKEHFYIHVSGEPQSGNPIFAGSTDSQRLREADFSSSGINPGILQKRPDNYVPFLVPLFDEANTELQMQAYRTLKEANPDQFNEAPTPIYKWVYRPEMQFTSYDLTVDAINKSRDADGNGTIEDTEITNILNDETPLITSDSVIDILYGLSTTDLLPLDYFNAGDNKELVFVIGEQEITATLGADQTLNFNNLSSLDLLSPDDFLSIRLYANNDMGNVLWEFAFMNLDVDVDSDNNNGLELPDRTDEEEQVENVEGHPGKILTMNTGDTDEDGIPDYADFDIGEGFAPMIVQIPDDVDIATAKIKFIYEQSDPTIINVDDTVDPPVYEPDTGYLRIWTKNGTEARNINDVSAGGHYIRSEEIINLSLFSIDAERVIVLYTELVNDKDDWSSMKTRIEIIE